MNRNSRIYVIFTAVTVIAIAMAFQNCARGFESTLPMSGFSNSSSNSGSFLLTGKDSEMKVGEIMTTDAGKALALDINGRVVVTVKGNNTSEINVFASGLTAGQTYMTHVHAQPCAIGAGGHYKIDPAVTATIENNEMWVTLTADATGNATGSESIPNHRLRADAVSFVIHAADGAKIACADFAAERKAVVTSGTFATLPGGIAQVKTIAGSGVIVRNANGYGQTLVQMSVQGLTPATAHVAHVHNQPCNLQEGGGHYKQNNAVAEMVATANNELWLNFTTSATGSAFVQLNTRGHVARADALSIVIHDPVTPATRLACLDFISDGGVFTTEVGLARGRSLTGKAVMERTPTSTTKVSLVVNGLLTNTSYVPHVHDRACVTGGGGHYKFNPADPAVVDTNEMWLPFTTDANGRGTFAREWNHIARAEAQSIIIHDPADGGRIGCVDLY